MDKGYQGFQNEVRAIIPNKKPVSRSLNNMEKKINEIGSDRVTIENYFGQMMSLWEIMKNKYRWSEDL